MDALSEYQAREQVARSSAQALDRRSRQIGNARLLTAIAFAVLLWQSIVRDWPGLFVALVLALPAGVFAALLIWHAGVRARGTRASRVAAWYAAGIARIQDKWAGHGASGDRFLDPQHIYAQDIDLFGRGSLFQLVSRARTTIGEAAIADWLLHPATPAEVGARQAAVRELAAGLDLREDLELIGAAARVSDPSQLMGWSKESAVAMPRLVRPGALLLAIAGLASAAAAFSGRAPVWPFALAFAASAGFAVWLRGTLAEALAGLETSAADLNSLALLIARLERERFETPRLRQLSGALHAEGAPASARIARLRRWLELLDSTDHILLRIVNPVLLLRQQFMLAIAAWRQQNAAYISGWLSAAGEFEALSSVAALSYERPHWIFPLIEDSVSPLFRAGALTHALLPADRAVPNDVELSERTRLLIVSGSNMSGKSTLLRSVGLATVLAFAGAPVPAAALTLSPLELGASLRATDSLQDNRSRFMAEIIRLREIVTLTKGEYPVLFLLDELLSGTNSHDRRIGASAIVKGLTQAGALGLITTHDLALTAIGEELPGHAANVHFTDEIVNGELHFDYRLRPGIVTHSNALELMRAVGLLP